MYYGMAMLGGISPFILCYMKNVALNEKLFLLKIVWSGFYVTPCEVASNLACMLSMVVLIAWFSNINASYKLCGNVVSQTSEHSSSGN